MNELCECGGLKDVDQNMFLEIALFVNKELYDDNIISYKVFQYTEREILKQLKK